MLPVLCYYKFSASMSTVPLNNQKLVCSFGSSKLSNYPHGLGGKAGKEIFRWRSINLSVRQWPCRHHPSCFHCQNLIATTLSNINLVLVTYNHPFYCNFLMRSYTNSRIFCQLEQQDGCQFQGLYAFWLQDCEWYYSLCSIHIAHIFYERRVTNVYDPLLVPKLNYTHSLVDWWWHSPLL